MAGSTTTASAALVRELSGASITLAEAASAITAALVVKVADVFNIIVSEIDPSQPLSYYGVDSLVAVELRNWLGSVTKAKVSIFELQSASVTEFGELVARKSEFLKGIIAQEAKA